MNEIEQLKKLGNKSVNSVCPICLGGKKHPVIEVSNRDDEFQAMAG